MTATKVQLITKGQDIIEETDLKRNCSKLDHMAIKMEEKTPELDTIKGVIFIIESFHDDQDKTGLNLTVIISR